MVSKEWCKAAKEDLHHRKWVHAGGYLQCEIVVWDNPQDQAPHHDPRARPDKNFGCLVELWAITCTAFFGFFHLGELILDAKNAFNPTVDFALRDVVVDNQENPQMIRIHAT